MQSKQTIATIFHRFFELLPIFQKRKIIYLFLFVNKLQWENCNFLVKWLKNFFLQAFENS